MIADRARAWFEEFAACVRGRDIEAGRRLFDPTCASFGARTDHLTDLDDLVARQWTPTWTTTRGFAAVSGTMRIVEAGDASLVVLTARWASEGIRPDGATFERRGRCTVVLRADDDAPHGLLAVHTHFSRHPEDGQPTS